MTPYQKYQEKHPDAAPPNSRRRAYWARKARQAVPIPDTCHCGLGFGFGPDPTGHPRLTPSQVGKGKNPCPVR